MWRANPDAPSCENAVQCRALGEETAPLVQLRSLARTSTEEEPRLATGLNSLLDANGVGLEANSWGNAAKQKSSIVLGASCFAHWL